MIHIFFYYSIKTFRQKSFFPIVQVSKIIISDEIFIRTCTKSEIGETTKQKGGKKSKGKKKNRKKKILLSIGFNRV